MLLGGVRLRLACCKCGPVVVLAADKTEEEVGICVCPGVDGGLKNSRGVPTDMDSCLTAAVPVPPWRHMTSCSASNVCNCWI